MDISNIKFGNTTYSIKDDEARKEINEVKGKIVEIQGTTIFKCTLAQYNALTDEQKADAHIIYAITDISEEETL